MDNTLIDKFCCLVAVMTAVTLLVMGIAEMHHHNRISYMGTCGASAMAASPHEEKDASQPSASAKNVHAGESIEASPGDDVGESYENVWMKMDENCNTHKGQPQDEQALLENYVWEADDSVNKTFAKAPKAEELLQKHGQRPFGLTTTQMEGPTNSRTLGGEPPQMTLLKKLGNSSTEVKFDCTKTIDSGISDVYWSARKKSIEEKNCDQ